MSSRFSFLPSNNFHHTALKNTQKYVNLPRIVLKHNCRYTKRKNVLLKSLFKSNCVMQPAVFSAAQSLLLPTQKILTRETYLLKN